MWTILKVFIEFVDQPRQHIKKQRHYIANKGPSSQSYGFSSSLVWMWELDHKEGWAPENWGLQTVVLEKTLGSSLDRWEIHPVNPKGNQPWILIHEKDWCWSWSFNTLAIWCEEPTHWKIPWCWERLKAGGEVDNRGWDGWMASPNQCTWVWANSGRGWRTGRPGMLQSMGLTRIRHDSATEQQQHAKRTTNCPASLWFLPQTYFCFIYLKKEMSYCIILSLNIFFC